MLTHFLPPPAACDPDPKRAPTANWQLALGLCLPALAPRVYRGSRERGGKKEGGSAGAGTAWARASQRHVSARGLLLARGPAKPAAFQQRPCSASRLFQITAAQGQSPPQPCAGARDTRLRDARAAAGGEPRRRAA